MKKITALFALLMLVCMGAQAQTVTATLMEGYGEPLTLTQFEALAGTNGRFGFVASSNTAGATQPRCDHWVRWTGEHNGTLADDALFYLEKSGDNYLVKRVSDDQYVISDDNETTFGTKGTEFKLVERNPNDKTAAVWKPQSISFENPNDDQYHYNANTVKMNTGPGAWTTYAVFGPIWKVTVKCVDASNNPIEGQEPILLFGVTGSEVEVTPPTIAGYTVNEGYPTSVTINNADEEVNITYASSSFDYTLVVNGAPDGTTIIIKGNPVALDAGTVSFSEAVTENDIQVTFPSEFYDYNLTISGATITIDCRQAYPVNFPANSLISVGEKVSSVTAVTSPADNDHWYIITQVRGGESVVFARETNEKLRRGTAAQTANSFDQKEATDNGAYLVRFVSIGENDFYKIQFGNGYFVDNQLKPSTTSITDAATYVFYNSNNGEGSYFGWNINDKSGDIVDNNGAGHDLAFWEDGEVTGTSGNNVWYVYPVSIKDPSDFIKVTYRVVDGSNNLLYESPEATVSIGSTELPAEYQQPLFYTYSGGEPANTSGQVITFTATLKDDAPFQFTADTSAPVWYYLKNQGNNSNPNGAYPTYVEGSDPNVTLPTANAENATTSWAFIGNPYNGFQIVNEAAGTSLILGSAGATGNGGDTYATLAAPNSEPERREVWTIEASSYATNGFFIRNADGHALNLRSNANLAYWTGGADKGSTFVATKVPSAEEKYLALIEQLVYIPFGTGLGQYSLTVEGDDKTEEADKLIDDLMKAGYTSDNMVETKKLFDGASLNMPKANTFLRIKSVAQNGYVSSTTGEEVQPGLAGGGYATSFTTSGTAEEANTIWFYDGTHLMSYVTGLYCTGRMADEPGVVEPVTYTFSAAEDAMSKYWIKPSNTNYWYGGTPTLDYWSAPVGKEETRFELEEVTELPITLHEADCKDGQTRWFATFSAPVAVSEVIGAKIHKVTDMGSSVKVELANVTGIPAETAVLLVSETNPAELSEAPKLVLGKTTDVITTDLLPLYACEKGKEGLFFGEGAEGYAGFYTIDAETLTGGFTAYVVDDGNIAKVLDFSNDATGINTIENGAENGAVYNLQGQRVNKAQKGVYIQNGRKVVLK